ncbi:MAG TPA: hypothetical protein VIS96_18180 [Terrimicrobiaceae bacterium]
MDERYLTFTEETNALDYLERASRFIRHAATDDTAWKWVIIALHGSLYGFAICACKGTDHHNVTRATKGGDRRLISFGDALKACQDPQRMRMTVMSKPLVLSEDQRAAIKKIQESFRNPFEHYIPMSWHIEIHGMPTLAIHCLEVIRFLALETGNYTMLSGEQFERVQALVSESISFLSAMPLHTELKDAPHSTL